MRQEKKIKVLYGPSEEDFFPSEDAGSASSPSDSVAAGKIVAFSQPLDAIAVGIQLSQVYPLLQQLSRQVSDLTAEVKVLKACLSSLPQSSAADDVGWLDAEGARPDGPARGLRLLDLIWLWHCVSGPALFALHFAL